MTALKDAASEFLSHRRIAVAGVSRGKPDAANYIYRKLRDSGYETFAVNPAADQVEGDACYHTVVEIPGGVDGVVVVTHPAAAPAVVADCAAAGVRRVWIHRAIGAGSLSAQAVAACETAGIAVIAGGCPMMFLEPVDVGHRCMRAVMRWTGRLPDGSGYRVQEPAGH